MIAYTFKLKRTERKDSTLKADGLQAAIRSVSSDNVGSGWDVKSVRWDGGAATINGICEGCPTFLVDTYKDGDEEDRSNYQHDSRGVALCDPCMAALIADSPKLFSIHDGNATWWVAANAKDEASAFLAGYMGDNGYEGEDAALMLQGQNKADELDQGAAEAIPFRSDGGPENMWDAFLDRVGEGDAPCIVANSEWDDS